jgi:two-component system, NtrC family, sensor kinase
VSQRSIETSLMRSISEVTLPPSWEAPAPSAHASVLVVESRGECPDGIATLLAGLGAIPTVVSDGHAALARVEHESFAFVLVDEADEPGAAEELVRRIRMAPRAANAPLVLLVEDEAGIDPALSEGARASGPVPSPRSESEGPRMIRIQRAPVAALAAPFGMLLELYRSRARNVGLSARLEFLERDLRRASDDNALLAEQARRASAELESAQAQLVQAAKLAALGELVAGIAHEINNPLSFSLSHMSTLRRGINESFAALGEFAPETRGESARLEERLVGVTLGLERIKSLVVKLQTFTRLDEGKSQSLDVADAIGTVLTILHHRVRDRIQVTTDFGKPNVIQCDPSLINQCVMNLVVNAIDAVDGATPEGSVHISARGEGESYVIRVIDNGPGVAAEIEHKIFDAFFTTKPIGKGTGLGLSIASSVVKKHEGTLTLSPGPNGGTQAVIRLPLARVAASRRR